MPRVTHFELLVDDANRASEFYETVFHWKVQGWEGEEGY
jgi:predicted enzyme related to lactoylglutathione lyase